MLFDEKEYEANLEKEKILTMQWLKLNQEIEELTIELYKVKENNATVRENMRAYIQKNFMDLEATVFNMNVFQGYSLKEIADKLGFSYDHIRRVKSQIARKLRK